MADQTLLAGMSTKPRRSLPVVRWLQVGTVAAGVGLAMAAAPSALADDGSASDAAPAARASSPGVSHSASRRGAAVAQVRSAQLAVSAAASPKRSAGAARAVKAPAISRVQAADVQPGTVVAKVAVASTVAPAVGQDPLGQLAAFFAMPWAPANTNPTLASWGLLADIQLRNILSGAPAPVVTDQTAVITGLFRQLIRRDPTSDELSNYTGIMNLTGVAGAVASLYDSTAFRQGQVNAYYQEILDRNADAGQLGLGTTLLLSGLPEPLLAAAIAGTREAYTFSSSGGGTFGVPASAETYVSLLYRNLLGDIAQLSGVGQSYVNQIQAGLPIGLAATEFVTSAAFRSAKIDEIYNALGTTADASTVQSYVDNWFWSGGLDGIATSLLSGADNITAIQTAPVALPNATALQQYTNLLLAPYDESATGFVNLFRQYLKTDPVTGNECLTNCNTALLDLINSSGDLRGMPNNILSDTSVVWANTRDIIPNQTEVDMDKSIKGPLSLDDTKYGDPLAQLQTYLAGGQIVAGGGMILTSDNGKYVLDGHHRWSTLFLVNPNTQIQSLDLGYVPNPKEGLTETQISIVNRDGQLNVATVTGQNLFTVSQEAFDVQARYYIDNNNTNAATVTFTDPKTGQVDTIQTTNKDVLLATYYNFLHAIPNTYEAQKFLYNDPAQTAIMETETVNYLWGNVLLMRDYNQPPAGSVSRKYMPQPADGTTYPPYLAPLQSGKVAFTFPIISYIG